MNKTAGFFFLVILNASAAFGQEAFNTAVPREVLVLSSTRSYPEALQTARNAAAFLRWKMTLRGYGPHPTAGLTAPKSDCEANGYEYPCYVARANGSGTDDFNTISVEYSNAYPGMAEGYYIVVAAIDKPAARRTQIILSRVRKKYPAAYVKRTEVWLGCLH